VLQTRQDGREELWLQERFLYAKWSLFTDGEVPVTGVISFFSALLLCGFWLQFPRFQPLVTGVMEAKVRWRVFRF
jgi:hypothetical protein